MPRAMAERPSDEAPDSLRQQAARARRLANSSSDDRASRALIAFAEELEARAAELERGNG
jgi:hypothetical protein